MDHRGHPDANLVWSEHGRPRSARWRSASGTRPPSKVELADDTLSAAGALCCASQGIGLLWRGDLRGARRLLAAMQRQVDRRAPQRRTSDPADAFSRYRQHRKTRARLLGMLLVELGSHASLKVAQDAEAALSCRQAYGEVLEDGAVSLRELLGALSAGQWSRRGVFVPALGERIHPHYGVFAPTRDEHVTLVAATPMPSVETAFDIGTGTGVLAALLARRGAHRVLATDLSPRAVTCAQDNITRLGLTQRVTVTCTDLFPPGRADLVVCNPPWLPATPSSPLDAAVFDPEGRMLAGFLQGVAEHLHPGGQAWLVLSDLAELLGLRSRTDLLAQFEHGGLVVHARIDIGPTHTPSINRHDPLAAARAAERISLWQLRPRAAARNRKPPELTCWSSVTVSTTLSPATF